MADAQRMVVPATSWRLAMWCGIAALLVLPFVAMRFTSDVRWGAEDFAAALLLLGGGGFAVEAAMRFVRRPSLRLATVFAVVLVVGLIWAQAAVGIV